MDNTFAPTKNTDENKSMNKLDTELLELFTKKGEEQEDWQEENLNAFEIRRISQIVMDLYRGDIASKSFLDIACGEGTYSVELALRGAKSVQGIDAREERMSIGMQAQEKLNLSNLNFKQADLRPFLASCPVYDSVLLLGILYHLDDQDLFEAIEQLYNKVNDYLIIDTHISSDPLNEYVFNDRTYYGHYYKEHSAGDTEEEKVSRQLNSVDNDKSYWLSHDSLVRLLRNVGFTSIYECHGPTIPSKLKDRVTLIAVKGSPQELSTYPWVNDHPDRKMDDFNKPIKPKKSKARKVVDFFLNPLGLTLRKL